MLKKLLIFPLWEIKNVRLFYLIEAGLSLWFVEAVWYFYWAKFASYSDIGIIFSVLTLVWILAEVPTGALADMLGRRFSVIIGCMALFLGSLALTGAQNFWYLIVGGLLQNIGRAFVSGSLEALVYDDLKNRKKEGWFDDIMAARSKIKLAAYASATVIGGFIYPIYFRLPHIATAIFEAINLGLSFMLTEVTLSKRPKGNFKNYMLQNLEGFKQLAQKNLRPYLFIIIAISSVYYLYDWGFSRPAIATNFGFDSKGMGLIYTGMALVNIYIVGKLMFLRNKFGDLKGIIYLNFMLGLGFILSTFSWGFYGIVIIFLIETVGSLSDPWISVIINREINSEDRATTLSSLVFLSKIPFIFLIPLAGASIQNQSIANLHLLVGIFLVSVSVIYFLIKATNTSLVKF